MSRIASVKETGEELSPAEWERFEEAVAAEVETRPEAEPYGRDALAKPASATNPAGAKP